MLMTTPTTGEHREREGRVRLGGGLLVALAAGAAGAGWWLLAGVVLAFLRPAGREQGGLRVLLLGAVAVLAAFAALYQLGSVRLGLSLTSLRDLLSAADAEAVQPLLTAVAVVATVVPALAAGTEVRARAGVRGLAGLVLAAVA